MSRLTWQSLSQDTVSDLIDAYTLESISEGEAFVTCEECRRTYLVRTIAQVGPPTLARCIGCGARSMRRGVRAFSGGAEIEPDPDIVPGSMVSLQAAVRRGFESGAVVRVPPGTYRGTLILEGAITVVGTEIGRAHV